MLEYLKVHTWSFIVFLYIYDLTQGHSSWFSVIHDIQTSANNLNKDLERISKWTTQ